MTLGREPPLASVSPSVKWSHQHVDGGFPGRPWAPVILKGKCPCPHFTGEETLTHSRAQTRFSEPQKNQMQGVGLWHGCMSVCPSPPSPYRPQELIHPPRLHPWPRLGTQLSSEGLESPAAPRGAPAGGHGGGDSPPRLSVCLSLSWALGHRGRGPLAWGRREVTQFGILRG